MEYTFFLHTDGIWADDDMPEDYSDELAEAMATELETMFPDVSFDWIVGDNDMADTRTSNPSTMRDNAEALEAHPDIEEMVNRAYELTLEKM